MHTFCRVLDVKNVKNIAYVFLNLSGSELQLPWAPGIRKRVKSDPGVFIERGVYVEEEDL